MGKKSKSSTKPVYSPQLEQAAGTISDTYAAQAPKIAGYADQIGGLVPGLLEKYQQGNAGINAAQDYNVGVLGGEYLGANPYIDDVIARGTNDTVNAAQAAMGLRGLTGGSDYAGLIADRVSNNALATRYADYNNERARMATAAGQSPSLAAGEYLGISPLLAATQTAGNMPMDAALKYGAGIGGLLGPYTNTKQKENPGLLDYVGTGLSALSLFSDVRLKENIVHVGQTEGGLPIYTYNYIDSPVTQMGVMAQDVAAYQPEALGQTVGGYMTVNYGKVR